VIRQSWNVAVIQARMTSTRLPGKVLLPLAGAPLLTRVIERVARIHGVDELCVAAPEGSAHDPIEELVRRRHPGVRLVRGPEQDVLARFRIAAEACGATTVLRITSDCPLLDPGVSGAVLALRVRTGVALASTALERGYPVGLDTEAVCAKALLEAEREAQDPYEREHVTPFLWRRPERYPALYLDHRPDRRDLRLSVDTPSDYALVSAIYDSLHASSPCFGFCEVERLLDNHPELAELNRNVHQKRLEWGLPALEETFPPGE